MAEPRREHAIVARGDRVRVVVFGTGTVGTATLALCTLRPWIEVVGVIGRSGAFVGDVSTGSWALDPLLGPDDVLEELEPDVAVVATRSPIADVLPDIERCARLGIAVVCTSEELAWPGVTSQEDERVLHVLAASHRVAIHATGINPGFVFDAVPLVLSSASWDVQHIHITRSLDASVFGRSVHRSLGVGYDPGDVDDAIASGVVRGHIGFEESATTIAARMGLSLSRFEERIEPIVADREYELREYRIHEGQTAGVTQTASAWVGEDEWITFDLSLHVDPTSVGWETGDRIRIGGRNALDVVFHSGTQAVLTTSARLVNAIPGLLAAAPGFYTGSDLLPGAPWLGGSFPRT